jgi:uncharacterized membrane protein
MLLAFIAVACFISIGMLYNVYQSFAFDLGTYTQIMQSPTLYGQLIGSSEFATHFSPILYLLVPLFKLAPYPQTLLIIQAIALGGTGPLIYILARHFNLSIKISLLVELLYFISPLTWGILTFDFHEVCFAPLCLLLLLLGLVKRKWWLFGLGLFLSLMIKEDVTFTVGVLGIALLLTQRKVSWPIVSLIGGALLTATIGTLVAKWTSPNSIMSLNLIASRFTGGVGTFFSFSSLWLVLAYLGPLAFLPLLSWWALPGLAILVECMISNFYGQHNWLWQYPGAAIAYLFTSLVAVLRVRPKIREAFEGYFIGLVVISMVVIFTMTRVKDTSLPNQDTMGIDATLALIPNGVTVTANNEIFDHLMMRDTVYLPNEGLGTVPFTQRGFPQTETQYVVIAKSRPQGNWEVDAEKELPSSYNLISSIDGTELWRLK